MPHLILEVDVLLLVRSHQKIKKTSGAQKFYNKKVYVLTVKVYENKIRQQTKKKKFCIKKWNKNLIS